MGRPSALLIMGGADYHNTAAHYELLAGLLAGPAGCNVTVTDDFPAQTEESLSRYDLLVLWATYTRTSPPGAGGRPLPGRAQGHAAAGSSTGRRTPCARSCRAAGGHGRLVHQALSRSLPYQEITVNILDHASGHGRGAGLRHRGRAVHCLEDWDRGDDACWPATTPGPRSKPFSPRARAPTRSTRPRTPGGAAASGPPGLRRSPGRRRDLRQRPGARRQRHLQSRLPPADRPGGALAHRRRQR